MHSEMHPVWQNPITDNYKKKRNVSGIKLETR